MKKGSVYEFLKHAVVRWEALTSDWVRFSINDLIWDSTNLVLAASAINSSPKRWNTSRYNFAYIMQLPKHSPERAHSKVSGDVIVETKLIRAFSFFFRTVWKIVEKFASCEWMKARQRCLWKHSALQMKQSWMLWGQWRWNRWNLVFNQTFT